jgi:uncharacterized protein YdeI (YjbR/CyaY-like superfamily)
MITNLSAQEDELAPKKERPSPTFFQDREDWARWLEQNHAGEREVWVIHQKKASRLPGLRYEEGVEEALRFGWIDSQMYRLDDETFALRYSPRRPGSVWAMSNRVRVERLLAEGRMTPRGIAAVEEAKRRGTWPSDE